MARPSGHWLAYLRFDYHGEVRVLHLFCDNRAQLDEVFSLRKGLPEDSGTELVEYAVFHSSRNVYLREAPNFPERHILTYATFMAAWRGTVGEPEPSAPPTASLYRLLGSAPRALEVRR
ncbi:MAG: hypothetical protein C0467_16190 [Planctomycetaceae bacterium]|nr:hypothetical protein [Planctomycetaceae bacterium]